MMSVKIITVGKLKEKYLRDACEEYQKRLSRFANVKIVELNEFRLSDNPSGKEIEHALEIEGDAILKEAKGFLIAMCIEGKQLSSEKLAKKLSDISVDGQSCISFIIGSSFGICDKVKNTADFKLSMSEMTFPHQLARVMLLEQIYRSFQINNNGKYHK